MTQRPGLGDVTGETFPTSNLISREMLIDSGLPTVVFVTVFALNGQVLQPALFAALGAGALLAVLRLVRRDSVQNVVGGFIALGVAAWFANRTGQAEDFFAPGLLINVGYGLAYFVSILVRWPLLGVLVSLATGEGMGWRQTPHLVRAYSIASWFWVAMFGLRLAVQLPLYLTESVVALGVARVVMGWPLFLLCLWLSWMVIKSARDQQRALEAAHAADRTALAEPDEPPASTTDGDPEAR